MCTVPKTLIQEGVVVSQCTHLQRLVWFWCELCRLWSLFRHAFGRPLQNVGVLSGPGTCWFWHAHMHVSKFQGVLDTDWLRALAKCNLSLALFEILSYFLSRWLMRMVSWMIVQHFFGSWYCLAEQVHKRLSWITSRISYELDPWFLNLIYWAQMWNLKYVKFYWFVWVNYQQRLFPGKINQTTTRTAVLLLLF